MIRRERLESERPDLASVLDRLLASETILRLASELPLTLVEAEEQLARALLVNALLWDQARIDLLVGEDRDRLAILEKDVHDAQAEAVAVIGQTEMREEFEAVTGRITELQDEQDRRLQIHTAERKGLEEYQVATQLMASQGAAPDIVQGRRDELELKLERLNREKASIAGLVTAKKRQQLLLELLERRALKEAYGDTKTFDVLSRVQQQFERARGESEAVFFEQVAIPWACEQLREAAEG